MTTRSALVFALFLGPTVALGGFAPRCGVQNGRFRKLRNRPFLFQLPEFQNCREAQYSHRESRIMAANSF